MQFNHFGQRTIYGRIERRKKKEKNIENRKSSGGAA
jgi:hypothetical protein